jgi:hypothetical protein
MTAIAKRKCAMCGGVPFGMSLDQNEPLFCSFECEVGWRGQQREASYLAALNLTPKPIFEAWGDLDLGEPEQAWACAVDRFREEARINKQCADQCRRAAEDATKQAEQHARRAEEFANLANAIERAPIAFAASADTRPKGGDSTEIEAPFTSGVVGEAETPNLQHHQNMKGEARE